MSSKTFVLFVVLVLVALVATACGPWSYNAACVSKVGDWTGCVDNGAPANAWLQMNGYNTPVINVNVSVPTQPAPIVNVNVPTQQPPVVNVNVPTTVPPTSVPPPPTPAPTSGPVAGPYISLNYDETNSDPLTPGQKKLIALYLRDVMGQNGTQAAMEAAISSIQREAQNARATVREGDTFVPPRDHAWLVWCSNASGVTEPTDVSDVFGTHRTGPGKVWVVVPFAAGVPWPSLNTFSGCTGGKFWAVAVH